MFRSGSDRIGLAIEATDGKIGKVADVRFDDRHSMVREERLHAHYDMPPYRF